MTASLKIVFGLLAWIFVHQVLFAFAANERLNDISESNCDRQVRVSLGMRQGTVRYSAGDGFFYHRQREVGGRVYMRCANFRSNPPCRVRASMQSDFSNFLVLSGVHNHGPDMYHDRVAQLRTSLLEASRVRPNVRIDILYHDVCRSVDREISSRLSLAAMRPSMIRVQSENRPNIPRSFDELSEALVNNLELGRTLDQEMELYQGMTGPVGHRSVVFMSRRVMDGVNNVRHLFCDATFYARPNNPVSCQLFTIVTVRDNHIIPLCHALMEARTALAYQHLFIFLRNFAPNLDPDFIMSDFEQAEQLMLHEVFPRSRLSGCLWHYARAVCRNVRSLGLSNLVRDNDNARRIVRLCLAIPLAPPGRLQEALNSVLFESRRLNLFDTFSQFFDYVEATWIIGVGDATLSVFGVRHRTNNVAECHHRNLNSRLVRRPNIWRFLEILREVEDMAWRDLGRIELGLAPSRARRVASVLNDARVRSCSRQIMNREMDMLHFLAAVSWHLDVTMRDALPDRPDEERPASPQRCPPPVGLVSSCGTSNNLNRNTSSQRERVSNYQQMGSLESMPQDDQLQTMPRDGQSSQQVLHSSAPTHELVSANQHCENSHPFMEMSSNRLASMNSESQGVCCSTAPSFRSGSPQTSQQTSQVDNQHEIANDLSPQPTRLPQRDENIIQSQDVTQILSVHNERQSLIPSRHQFDADFEQEFSGIASCYEDMLPCHPNELARSSRRSRDFDLFHSLMEEYNVDDPGYGSSCQVGESRRRSNGATTTRATRRDSSRNTRRNAAHSTRSNPPRPDPSSVEARQVRLRSRRRIRDQTQSSSIGQSNLHHELRSENFSDEEPLSSENVAESVRRWQECLICVSRVGHYVLLGCGAAPVCGACIRQWFFTMRNNNCLHCGGPNHGWIRLNTA